LLDNGYLHIPLPHYYYLPPTDKTMADEEKEKAEKVAAAKKRVGSPLKRLLSLRDLGAAVSSSSIALEPGIPVVVAEQGDPDSLQTCADM